MGRAFLLTLQFDGTDYCGWQRQKSGRSIQGTVEAVLGRLADAPVNAVAAGRTDAGVHAVGMPVSIRMPSRWEPAPLHRALNSMLPKNIGVARVQVVPDGFDARRWALERHYRYDLATAPDCRSPFRGRTEWPLGRAPDTDLLDRAAAAIVGDHSFRAFAAVGEPKPHYRCAIRTSEWSRVDSTRIRYTIIGNRFLHHMVRMLVGTMVDIGLGRRAAEEMTMLLSRETNDLTSPPAPAAGLTFVAAAYPPETMNGEVAGW